MEIYILRHGQTDWNVNNIVQGNTNIPLNDVGISQAKEAINKIQEKNFDVIISSNLDRAIKTAEIINIKKLEHIIDDRLAERYLGDYQGLLSEENGEDKLYNIKYNLDINKIETAKELYVRVSNLLDELYIKYNNKKVLLVTHSGTTRAIEAYFLGFDTYGNMPKETLKNCELRKYKYNKKD